MNTKCSKCLEIDPDCFYGHWKSRCKKCIQSGRKDYDTAYRNKNREVINERIYEKKILREHGLTLLDYEQLSEKQGGRCAICGTTPDANPGRGRGRDAAVIRLAIDHDHATGQVRGLLCVTCNLALGYLKDSPEFCVRAADYLNGGGSS